MIDNLIIVECSKCHHKYKINPLSETRKYKCKFCNSTIIVKPLTSIDIDDRKIRKNMFNIHFLSKKIVLYTLLFLLILFFVVFNLTKHNDEISNLKYDKLNKSNKEIIVQSGKLNNYIGDIDGKNVYLYKNNGTIDSRPNNLEELCKDYIFYRNKIIEYSRSGNAPSAEKYRIRFNKINLWINEYNESDVQTMFSYLNID